MARRAYARQMLAILRLDNRAIEAAFAAVPREAFLGPPPWTVSSPFAGYRPLAGADPVILYQDLAVALDPARGVNNQPGLHAQLLKALGPKPCERVVHVGAGAGSYSAIVGRAGRPGRRSHGRQVRLGAGRVGQELPFRSHQPARRL